MIFFSIQHVCQGAKLEVQVDEEMEKQFKSFFENEKFIRPRCFHVIDLTHMQVLLFLLFFQLIRSCLLPAINLKVLWM